MAKRKSMKTLRRRIAISNQRILEYYDMYLDKSLSEKEISKIGAKIEKLQQRLIDCADRVYEQKNYYQIWKKSRKNG